MEAPDHQKEAQLLSTPKKLEQGFALVEKKDTSRGRVIFSLGELPMKVVYLTPLGNTLERISHNEVMYRGPCIGWQACPLIPWKATSKSLLTLARYTTLQREGADLAGTTARSAEEVHLWQILWAKWRRCESRRL